MWGRAVPAAPTPTHDTTAHPQQPTMDLISFVLQSIPCAIDYHGEPLQLGQIQLNDRGPFRLALTPDRRVAVMLRFTLHDTLGLEWQLSLENTADQNSETFSHLRFACLDLLPELPPTTTPSARQFPLIHYALGSQASYDDFMPRTLEFSFRDTDFAASSGRSSSEFMPYFNLQLDQSHGAFLALGWSGSWKTAFRRLPNRGLHAEASLLDAEFFLKPHERVTLPSCLLVPWACNDPGHDAKRSFTLFRRFMRDYIAPKSNGAPQTGKLCLRAWGGFSPAEHTARLQNIRKHHLHADIYAIDAGWNGTADTPLDDHSQLDSWHRIVGDWSANPKLYPHGLAGLAHEARQTAGLGFSAWFEFERAAAHSHLLKDHPELFLRQQLPPAEPDNNNLLNLGNPEARHLITELLADHIRQTNMQVLRIDFNLVPRPIWRQHDEPGRAGLTELHYLNGLYLLLDDLRQRFPDLIIDNCASGGRRLDYQMCRRSFPLMCRSDYFCNGLYHFQPLGTQLHTLALSRWLPLHADSFGSCSCLDEPRLVRDTYFFRSSIGSGVGLPIPARPLSDEEGQWYRKMLDDARRLLPYMSLDFNPLTGYSTSTAEWCAYQLLDADRGAVFAFRRDHSADATRTFRLDGIDPNATYTLQDLDGDAIATLSGSQLQLLSVSLPTPRSAKILLYAKSLLARP